MEKPITGFSLLACACGASNMPAPAIDTASNVYRAFCFMLISICYGMAPLQGAEIVAAGGVGIQWLQLLVRAAEQRVARLQEISMTRCIGLANGGHGRHRADRVERGTGFDGQPRETGGAQCRPHLASAAQDQPRAEDVGEHLCPVGAA